MFCEVRLEEQKVHEEFGDGTVLDAMDNEKEIQRRELSQRAREPEI